MWKAILGVMALLGAGCACLSVARADCDESQLVCEESRSAGAGSCDSSDGSSYRASATIVSTPLAWIRGSSECSSSGGDRSSSDQFTVSPPLVGVVWVASSESHADGTQQHDCTLRNSVSDAPCPAGLPPPDPGWGHLLP